MTIRSAAYTSAITTLEAQGAAYRSYARLVATQRDLLAKNPEQVHEVARRTSDEFQEISKRGPEVRAHLEKFLYGPERAAPQYVEHLDRVLEAVQKEAREAEREIRLLYEELEKWRDDVAEKLNGVGESLPSDREKAAPATGSGYSAGRGEPRPVIIDRQG